MRTKAISPMIATILLIAFTVAVATIVGIWLSGYARTTGGTVSSATENQTACINSYPNIMVVTSQSIIVANPGTETLVNVKCYAGNGSDISRGGLGSMGAGAMNSTKWCNSTNYPFPYESGFGNSIICTAQCRNIGVSGQCKSGESCWVI